MESAQHLDGLAAGTQQEYAFMDTRMDRISRELATPRSRRQALKLLGGGIVGGALAGAGLTLAGNDAAAQPAVGTGVPVTGTTGAGDTITGTLTDLGAALNDAGDGFVLLGSIVGEITDSLGNVSELVDTFVADLEITQASCEILSLQLGPLNLDLLGLVIDLDQVNLDITAESGAGNLLGNLLCAVTNLLNNPSEALNGIANLLNRILGLLG